MIKSIKASSFRGIKEVILSNLEHINILIGKNNSGKSSILEAITHPDSRSIGLVDIELEKLLSLFSTQNGHRVVHDLGLRIFKEECELEFSRRRPVFWDTLQRITERVNNRLLNETQTSGTTNNNEPPFNILEIFTDYIASYEPPYDPVLIPANRRIETMVPVSNVTNVSPGGIGITNSLFRLKNAPIGSAAQLQYYRILETFRDITDYSIDISFDSSNKNIVLKYGGHDGSWVKAEHSGLGLSQVLVIVYFSFTTSHNVILIEEPESHLHPDLQRRLLAQLTSVDNKQFIISTHSNVFLDSRYIDRVFYVKMNKHVQVIDETTRASILGNLGYLSIDNIQSDLLILTEGVSDFPVIKQILTWLSVSEKCKISYFPLNGGAMAGFDLEVFLERSKIIALLDNEPENKSAREKFKANCSKYNVECMVLERYSIENYFSPSAIVSTFSKEIPSSWNLIEKDTSIENQLKKVPGCKITSIKHKNSEIVKKMELKDFEGTDLLEFCNRVKALCNTMIQ